MRRERPGGSARAYAQASERCGWGAWGWGGSTARYMPCALRVANDKQALRRVGLS